MFSKILPNLQENTSAGVFFSWIIGRRSQTCNFIKKDSSIGESFQNFEKHLSHRTAVEDCFWMYQNITAIKLTKSYKESGSIGRSKLFLPTHINYQSGTLVEGFLNHVIKSFTQLLYLILDRISIFSFSKSFLKICKTTCFLFLNILTQGKLFVAFRRRRLLN